MYLVTIPDSFIHSSLSFCVAKTNFPLQEYDKEVLEYWHLKSLCTSDEEEKRLVESYTLPIGRTVSSEEFKRGIVITGEALTSSLTPISEQTKVDSFIII